jgi:hypothetical protein
MVTISKTQAIRHAFFRLGMQATPKSIVQALSQQDIKVTEELVKLVRFEMLKETTGAGIAKVSRQARPSRIRRYPQGIPCRKASR